MSDQPIPVPSVPTKIPSVAGQRILSEINREQRWWKFFSNWMLPLNNILTLVGITAPALAASKLIVQIPGAADGSALLASIGAFAIAVNSTFRIRDLASRAIAAYNMARNAKLQYEINLEAGMPIEQADGILLATGLEGASQLFIGVADDGRKKALPPK